MIIVSSATQVIMPLTEIAATLLAPTTTFGMRMIEISMIIHTLVWLNFQLNIQRRKYYLNIASDAHMKRNQLQAVSP